MAVKKNTRNKQQTKSIPWGPMLLSFVVGAFVMFLLHLKGNVPVDKHANKASAQVEKKKSKAVEPTFDFYTLLPEMEVVVDDVKTKKQTIVASSAAHHTPKRAVNSSSSKGDKTTYLIQVGSFKNLSDADGYRAKLAFLGVESRVQSVTIDNRETWHRVQIGPIIGRKKADSLQKILRKNNINSLLLREKKG